MRNLLTKRNLSDTFQLHCCGHFHQTHLHLELKQNVLNQVSKRKLVTRIQHNQLRVFFIILNSKLL